MSILLLLVAIAFPPLSPHLQILIASFTDHLSFSLASIPDTDASWITDPLFFSCQDPQCTRRLASRASLGTPPLRTHFYCLGSAPSPFVCFPSSFCLATTAIPSLVFLFLLSHRPYRLLPSLHLCAPLSRLGYNSFRSFSLQRLSAIAMWVCPW